MPTNQLDRRFEDRPEQALRRRLSDYDAALDELRRRPIRTPDLDRRLVAYFAIVLLCTVLGVGLAEMRVAGATWASFIIGAAFLLAAVRRLTAQAVNG